MDPPIPYDAKRLLIEMPSWLGDTVMATPVLRAVREARPAAHIMAMLRPPLDQVLAGTPFVDELMVVQTKGPGGVLRAARAMRRFAPDGVLLLPNSFRSGLGAWLSRAPRRVGFARDLRRWFLTHPIEPPAQRPVPAVEYYGMLARAALEVEPVDPTLTLTVMEKERETASVLLEGVDRPFALLNPGANRVDKRWPAERFAVLGDVLNEKFGLAIAVTGAPSERDVVNDVVKRMKCSALNLVERGVTLGSLKAVIERAAILITNDTGPRHIAAALRTPCVVLFGPTDHRWTTLSGAPERLLLAEPFLPEDVIADDHPKECAIGRIPVADVVAAVESLLGAEGAGAGAEPRAQPASTPRAADRDRAE